MKKVIFVLKRILLILLMTLMILATCFSFILNAFSQTIFDRNYIKYTLNENGVYTEIVTETKKAVKKAYSARKDKPADLEIDKVLDYIILEEPLRKEIEESIDELYDGRKIEVSGDYLAEEYSKMINQYIAEKGRNISPELVNWIVKSSVNKTIENVDLNRYTDLVSEYFAKLIKLFSDIEMGCNVLLVCLFVLIMVFYRERLKKLGIVSLVSGILMFAISSAMLTLSQSDSAAQTLQKFISSVLVYYFLIVMLLALGEMFFGITLLIISGYLKKRKKNIKKPEKIPGIELPVSDSDALCLLPKKKRGFFRLIFSRAGLTIILLLVQAVLLMMFFEWFEEYDSQMALISLVFRVIMMLYLFDCDMDATAKLTWLFLMMLFPVPACAFLLLTRNNVGHRRLSKRLYEVTKSAKGMIKQDEEVLNDPAVQSSGMDSLNKYLNLSGTFPIYKNTSVKYYPLGEYKFIDMLEELKKAEKFIFLEYFIIGEGLMWGNILKILKEKAEQGVEVRVMYDGMCEISTLTPDYPKHLAKLGIKCKAFSKLYPFVSTEYNYRDHRKILVIDGKVAFNGGVNLADEYINHEERFGHWKDTAVMIKGDAVDSFTLMFLEMWKISEKEDNWEKYLGCGEKADTDGFVMPYCDSPLDEYKAGESVYMDILNRAKHYVHIMTPYLILDNELESALKFAAERGVDVRLILPGIPDKLTANSLAKSHYKFLIQSGVKIYEYDPGFVHAKVFVCDDEKAVVGTINLDYRSLYHHFECATYIFRNSCIRDIEEDYNKTLERCSEVTLETIRNEKKTTKIRGSIAKLVAPLM